MQNSPSNIADLVVEIAELHKRLESVKSLLDRQLGDGPFLLHLSHEKFELIMRLKFLEKDLNAFLRTTI